MANGEPDLSGFWKGTTQTRPGGNIGKDLPGWKLPLTPAGGGGPEARPHGDGQCGSRVRHRRHRPRAQRQRPAVRSADGEQQRSSVHVLVQLLAGCVPFAPGLKHSDNPNPSFFGEEIGRIGGARHARHRLDRLQGRRRCGSTRTPTRTATRCASSNAETSAPTATVHPRRHADRGIRSSARGPSPTGAPGRSASRTRAGDRGPAAARTTWTRRVSGSVRVRSAPTGREATTIPRRSRRRCRRSRLRKSGHDIRNGRSRRPAGRRCAASPARRACRRRDRGGAPARPSS